MKVIAILDMIELPTVCKECRFREGELKGYDLVWLCHLNDEYVELDTKSDYCPLRPLPQKKVGDDLYERYGSWTPSDEKEVYYRVGFNDCLDEITGETE